MTATTASSVTKPRLLRASGVLAMARTQKVPPPFTRSGCYAELTLPSRRESRTRT